jgi:hypothetical protein
MLKLFTRLVATTAALALVAVPTAAATGGSAGAGLWPADYQATPTDCGSFSADLNNFCFIDDGGSVELGVKFTSSKAVNIVGVRAYRVDAGAVTGSLWTADGTLLAGPAGFSGTATHSWQDVTFGAPVPIAPGEAYIASYFAPNADYAFEYNYFASSAFTAGPITALQSVVGDGNGVYCYAGASCFPTGTFRDTNYWVTPLWAYAFDGFRRPVDNGGWNGAKAGSAIPVKFSLGGDQGLDVITGGYPTATQIACANSSTTIEPVAAVTTASNSGLTYDAVADQYVYVWKTSKAWAGKCYRFELGLNDGTSHTFDVQFK